MTTGAMDAGKVDQGSLTLFENKSYFTSHKKGFDTLEQSLPKFI